MKFSSGVSSSLWALAAATAANAVISPKVFIVDFYDDEQNIWLGIPEFNLLEQNITLPGLSMKFPDIHCTKDGSVCQLVTGEGEVNAAGSALALVLSPLFNLTQTYFLTAGDGGINPKISTLGSVAFAQFAVQVALQYEIDAREKPSNFSTGYIPQGDSQLNVYPSYIYGTEVFQLNDALRQKAIAFAKTATLNDSSDAQAYRKLYAGDAQYAAALQTPSVLGCDTATSDVWWSGAVLGETFENTTKLFTNGTGAYCTTQQEDNAVLESFLRGHVAGLLDFSRIIAMRTASDFDRQPSSMSAAENLFNGQDAGYEIAVQNIYIAGIKVVQGILSGWDSTFAKGVAASNYVGDVFGSLGGNPSFGPGSVFDGQGAPAQTATPTTGSSGSSSTSTSTSTSGAITHVSSGLGLMLGFLLMFGVMA
ncbi:hypothetical protein PHLGIDRAFT_96274 [Phlebiopsis gigantea 11061_1 CR5-6]|uniref:Purine nucleoside permease n=1 Tax=Phlebiopsis gigantea (strain 11061_1 CR5-6) TaxID=745531 RepID=A0A0C3PB71_PHLG1|nr:hypothetical protein PHLGIDRAFT_96274 [Phlebiopsis gigantea 11061_1 CR5-6]